MPCRSLVWTFAVLAGLHSAASVRAEVDYLRDVKPLLATKCSACHGPLKQEAGLRIDASQYLRKGGDEGPVIQPNQSTESRLIQRVAADDEADRMPPPGEGESLKPEQIALLKEWIDKGAPSPVEEDVVEDPRHHWAYLKPLKPQVPTSTAMLSPIDALLEANRLERGLRPVNLADRGTLLRRVTFDLTGLPPTPEELRAFLADDSDFAYERVVDNLLARPEYGERWGRIWMDVWRYSDWDGFGDELRGSQKHIWRWRDWIVESLNADKPYDEMVQEMLAGDELAPDDPDVLRATGFLSRNYYKFNRQMWLDNVVEHTGKAFLGLTLNCAKCHDHKYDPLAQTDYYRFQAIFEPYNTRLDRLPGSSDLAKNGLSRIFDADVAAPTYLLRRGDERNPDQSAVIAPGPPAVFEVDFKPEPIEWPATISMPFLQGPELAFLQSEVDNNLAAAEQKLRDALQKTDIAEATVARRNLAAAEARKHAFACRLAADRAEYYGEHAERREELAREAARAESTAALLQAEYELENAATQFAQTQQKRNNEDPATIKADDEAAAALAKCRTQLLAARSRLKTTEYSHLHEPYPKTSTGRRLAFARWVTSRDNPLTARVAVNHLWLRHFGKPLVENVFDFGLRSPKPRQVALLDWLAVELMDQDWRFKPVHRAIVLSQTYRRASSPDAETTESWAHNAEIDRDNADFWRADIRRLDAEEVRDAVLAATGTLDKTQGGEDIAQNLGESVPRRSIYFRTAYEKQMRFLTTFDAASPNECYRRSESIIPHQALAMSNSPLTLEQSRILAKTLWEKFGGSSDSDQRNEAFIVAAFEAALSRRPSADEEEACHGFLSSQRTLLAKTDELTAFAGGDEARLPPSPDPLQRARENLIHVLFNHNDFATVR